VSDRVVRFDEPAAALRIAPGLTVVICTYQRPESTIRVLNSIARQVRLPDATMIIDGSVDARTADAIAEWRSANLRQPIQYWHVDVSHRGLTRQRNFALDRVRTDLVAFFDDDVVLAPNCLDEMERAHRSAPGVVGVGCFAGPDIASPKALWRLRRRLGVVPALQAGRYYRSGMSIPWELDPRRESSIEGDWLPGWGMMWQTAAARTVRFNDGFAGYAQGEDLDFSLRMARHGKLIMARAAELRHLPDHAGRPDASRLGYMEIYNRYQIHRRSRGNRGALDVVWFTYAWGVDTLMLCRHLIRPARAGTALRQIGGRFRAVRDLVKEAVRHSQPSLDR
jgi:GT2 family glycosyltransferase